MKKIFIKTVILLIVAIFFIQPILPIILSVGSVYAISGKTKEELEAQVQPGDSYKMVRIRKKYKVTYTKSFEIANVPACYRKWFQVGCTFSTTLDGVSAEVTAYGSDYVAKRKHTVSTYSSHYEEFYNVRVTLKAVYYTGWRVEYDKYGQKPAFTAPEIEVFGQLGADGWGPIKFRQTMNVESVKVDDSIYYGSIIVGNHPSNEGNGNPKYEYPEDEYPEDEYPEDESPENEYPGDEYPENEYPGDGEPEYPEIRPVIKDFEDANIELSNYNKRQYIIQLYERVFGRTPGENTISAYFDKTPQQIAISFMFDGESESRNSTSAVSYADFVRYCYNWILGKDANNSDIQSNVNTLEYYAGLGGEDSVIKRNLVREIVESDDFMGIYGGTRKDKAINMGEDAKRLYIKQLLKTVIGTNHSNASIDYQYNKSIQQLTIDILFDKKSEERNYISALRYVDFVKFCYKAIMGKEASNSELNTYVNKIDTSSKRDIIKDIVETETFLKLRNQQTQRITFSDKNLCLAVYKKLEEKGFNVIQPTETTIAMYSADITKVTSLDLSGKSISNLSGISAFSNLTNLNLNNNNLTKIEELGKLTKLKKLVLNNNSIGSNIQSICNLTSLEELQAENCGLKNSDINGKITKLTNLTKLFLSRNQLSDISSFTALTKLQILRADDNRISSIGKVGNMNLTTFTLKRNTVSTANIVSPVISTIAYAQEKNYNISLENCKIENGKLVVTDLEKNAWITINGGNFDGYKQVISCQVTKAQFNDSALAGKIKEKCPAIVSYKEENGKYIFYISTGAIEHTISELDLTATDESQKITDISGLEVFKNLSKLTLDNNNVQNLEKLSQIKTLRSLSLKSCGLTDLNSLKTVTSIVQLDVSNNEITNIDAISSLTKLENLQLSNNKIGNNLNAIASLSNLENLYISNNNISDLNGLKDAKITNLYANYNSIDNFSDLKKSNVNKIELQNNEVSIQTENREMVIPDIVRAMYSYSMHSLEFTNCKIENGKLVIDDNAYKAEVRATSGIYSDTVIKVNYIGDITPPVVDIQYNLNNETGNMDVVITSNEPMDIAGSVGWARSADNKTITKSYTYNTKEILEIRDLNKNSIEKEINITGLKSDRIPGISIEYSKTTATNRGVKVTISADVPLHDPQDGWVMADDRKSFSKVFEENISVLFTVDSEENYQKAMEISRKVDEGIPASDLMDEIDEVNYKRINFGFHISNIDKKAPDVQVEYNNNQSTKGTVIATIYSDEEIELKQNREEFTKKVVDIDEEGNVKYGIAIYYTKNTTEDVEVIDSAKNTSVARIDINNIDNKVDGLKYVTDTNTMTNQNVNLTVNANEKINVNSIGNSQASIIKNAKILYKEAKAKVVSGNMLYEVAGNMTAMPIMTGMINTLDSEPVAYLSENSNENNEGGNALSFEMTDNGYGTINASDVVGNSDAIFYDISSIDKDSPIAGIKSVVKNEDGSVTVQIAVNEEVQLTEDLGGWTLSEDMKTLTKTFTSISNETLKLVDLVGNEIEIPVNVDNVETLKYKIVYEYIEGTDKVLVMIVANEELEEIDGWKLLEDKKSLSKVVTYGTEEDVIINSVDGNSANVYISIENEDEDEALLETEDKTTDDQTQSPNAFPQTGKYVIFTIILSIILTTLTIITLKRYVKSMEEE